VRLISSRQGLAQSGPSNFLRVMVGVAGYAVAALTHAQGMPVAAASAASAAVEMTTFEAMATAKFEPLARSGETEVTPLLNSDGFWSTVVAIFHTLPWWAGVMLGVMLAGAIAGVWRLWQQRNQAWQAELDALGERTPGSASGPQWRKDSRVAGWRLSRFEELPQFWQDTVVMEREDAYDLDEDSPNARQRRWGRRANRVPRNRWATTVTPRGI
jgi:hypothetical protein